jgi:hypothetical protein
MPSEQDFKNFSLCLRPISPWLEIRELGSDGGPVLEEGRQGSRDNRVWGDGPGREIPCGA